jgi:SprT protein
MAFSWISQPSEAVKKAQVAKKIDADLTAWCRQTATEFGLPELAKQVAVIWNPRMRTTAGRAWWPLRMIELNPKIDLLDPQQTARTLRHELAHLIAYERAGRRKIEPHGIEWRKACAELGIPGEAVYHHLPLPRRTQMIRFHYVCPQCFTETKRVRKIKRPLACYACCKNFSGGQYDARFRLVEKRPA